MVMLGLFRCKSRNGGCEHAVDGLGADSSSHTWKPNPPTHFFTGVVQKKEFETTWHKILRVEPVVGATPLKSMD